MTSDPLPWLLSSSQPWVRYHALLDLEGRSERDPEVRAERSALTKRGWVADLLAQQRPSGRWGPRKAIYVPKYSGTNWKWLVLAELGVDRTVPGMRRASELVLHDWPRPDGGFDDVGEVGHFCITGNGIRALIQAGYASDPRVRAGVDWLVRAQLPDGGWDCFDRKQGTLDCWEALSAFAALPPGSRSPAVRKAIDAGCEFYLSRRLLNEGRTPYAAWRRLHYPRHYYYDFLLGLELMTELGHARDRRLRPALDLLREKQRPDGTWVLEAVHPDLSRGSNYYRPHAQPFSLEKKGAASEILTLRAMRVLHRASG
jgi:hypothetical protein